VKDTLDPEAVKALDPGNSSLRHALDMLQHLSEWEPHMLLSWDEIPSFFARGTSRRMIKHHARLIHYLVVRDIRQCDIKVVTNMFTVDKKDESLRLVVDGRKVNVLMETPPKMELPSIQDVIAYIMSNNFALTVDGSSYFYQFAISEEVGTMFCANLSAARGLFRPVAMTRMPMGWSYAPYIAQKVSNTLLRGKDGHVLGLAWIDNFIFAGATEEEVRANFQEFLENCDKCNVQVDDRNPQPVPTLSALGLFFDLSAKNYQLDPSWVDKRVFTLSRMMTPRQLYEITGCAIWHDYVKKIPLCHRSECIDIIRRVAALVSETAAWDTPTEFSEVELSQLRTWTEHVKRNAPRSWVPTQTPELDLWSDASDNEWAALVFAFDELIAGEQGRFEGDLAKLHIFLKEAFAANVMLSATKGIPRSVNIDNKPLVQCIQRGYSTNRYVNSLIKTWDIENIFSRWVPTEKQRADPFTRGSFLPPTLPNLQTKSLRRPRGPSHNTFV